MRMHVDDFRRLARSVIAYNNIQRGDLVLSFIGPSREDIEQIDFKLHIVFDILVEPQGGKSIRTLTSNGRVGFIFPSNAYRLRDAALDGGTTLAKVAHSFCDLSDLIVPYKRWSDFRLM